MTPAAGQRLRRLVGALRIPYGVERSCKISRTHLERDRFLLSIAMSTLGATSRATLNDLLDALHMPRQGTEHALTAMAGARIVHFGHEATREGPVTKVYFEYALPAPGGVLHHAFKWRADREAVVETFYRTTAASNRVAILDLVTSNLAPSSIAIACLQTLLAHPKLSDAEGLQLLDVSDPDTRRRSFDLNVYGADLDLARLPRLTDLIAKGFGIRETDMDRLLAAIGSAQLGHFACGIDRTGQPFATLYYGAEGR